MVCWKRHLSARDMAGGETGPPPHRLGTDKDDPTVLPLSYYVYTPLLARGELNEDPAKYALHISHITLTFHPSPSPAPAHRLPGLHVSSHHHPPCSRGLR